jgi:hypothetical protein
LFELGDHERALAIAPGVGIEYWQDMTQSYGKILASNLDEDCVPFFAAGGRPGEAVNFYTKRRQFREAFLIASAASSGSFPGQEQLLSKSEAKDNVGDDGCEQVSLGSHDRHSNLMQSISSHMAEHYLEAGESVLAATAHLASNDARQAIKVLLDKGVFLLAFGLAKVAGMEDVDERIGLIGKLKVPPQSALRSFARGRSVRVEVEERKDSDDE